MEPTWKVLRDFRNRAGFHADKPEKFFEARFQLRKEWPKVEAALNEFKNLFDFFLKAERTEMQREQFKAYQ
jgi:hypothetical protein